MAKYPYQAVDGAGRNVRGVIEAETRLEALQALQQQRLYVVNLGAARTGSSLFSMGGGGRVRHEDILAFTWQFATMVGAGIPLLKCLDILKGQAKNQRFKEAIGAINQDVQNGATLADSLARHPAIFSRLYVNMVRAAEVGGLLDQVLVRVAQFLENDMEIRHKIKSAMMYPILVLSFAVIMMAAMFNVVLPQFKSIFSGMNIEMPTLTKVIFTVSDLSAQYWYVPPAVLIGVVLTLRALVRTPSGRVQYDAIKLRVPIVGELVLKMAVSRFSRTLGVLVASGVPLVRCLEIVGETSGNAIIANALDKVRTGVLDGQRLSMPMAATGLFPSMVVHMVDVGEESGQLSEMLVKVSDFFDKEVDAAVKGLTSMIEPALIILMGVLVGIIAVSIMGPIFTLAGSIN